VAKLTQQTPSVPPPPEAIRAIAGFIISLIAGLLILVQGIVRLVRGELVSGLFSDEIRRRILAGLALEIVGIIAIILGIIILIGAYLIYSPGKEMAGGIIVLVLSVLSILTGGGFLAGLILGIVGGALGILKK
jgi:small-conductance mechanosensitive channel